MFIELVSALRCTRPHENSWLVAAAYRMEGRHVIEGVLGCPICRTEYPVHGGVVDFTEGAELLTARGGDASDPVEGEDDAVRLAALLGIEDVRTPVVLAGAWGALLPLLREMAPAPYILVNAEPPGGGEPVSALRVVGALPLAPNAAHGVALDAAAARDEGLLAGAVRVLSPGGRLVAPADAPLPPGLRELGRDERHWVAERVREAVATAPQPLLRRQ